MIKRVVKQAFVTAVIVAGLASCQMVSDEPKGTEQDSKTKPNVVVFLIDDLGVNDTSLSFTGEKTKYNERYQTPNLEKLANKGVKFDNARANAICVPSRVSLLTGQNFMRHQVKGDIVDWKNKSGTLKFPAGKVINDAATMLPAKLKQQGYYTVHAGKYHVCHMCDAQTSPTPEAAGFDVNIGGSFYGAPGSYLPEKEYGNVRTPGRLKGLEQYYADKLHLTEALTEESLAAVTPAVERQQPFFLYLAHYAVHTPIEPHKQYLSNYELTVGEPSKEAEYASMIEGMDASLGRVMAYLEEKKIADNTMVIFYSDNGGRVLGRGKKSLYGDWEFNFPARSGKASNYEGGIRVAGVISWPGKLNAGVSTEMPVVIEDIYSTVLEAAGGDVNQATHKVDGKNWLPYLTGKSDITEMENREMYFIMPYRFVGTDYNGKEFADGGVEPSAAVIQDDWKLLYFFTDERFELYNLEQDPQEQVNLIETQPTVTLDLAIKLDTYMKNTEVNDILPERTKNNLTINWPLAAFKNFQKEI